MGATNIMTRFFGVMSVTTLAASLGWIGCGSNNKQVATPEAGDAKKTELSSSSGDNPCKSKENCPPVAAQPNANFAPSGALLGYVGEPVNWTFTGIDTKSMAPDQASSTRRVMVLLDRIPSEAQFVPGKNEPLSVKVKIEWTPQKVYAGKQLDIILRDMDRCVMDLGEDECNEYSLKEKYDTKETVPWEIADKDALQAQLAAGGGVPTGNVVNVANPNCGPAPTTNTAVTTSLFTTMAGALINPQSAMPGLLSTVMGAASGGGGIGGATAQPTQC